MKILKDIALIPLVLVCVAIMMVFPPNLDPYATIVDLKE